jgi:hypothetical protein
MSPHNLPRKINTKNTALLSSDWVIKVDLVNGIDGYGVDADEDFAGARGGCWDCHDGGGVFLWI